MTKPLTRVINPLWVEHHRRLNDQDPNYVDARGNVPKAPPKYARQARPTLASLGVSRTATTYWEAKLRAVAATIQQDERFTGEAVDLRAIADMIRDSTERQASANAARSASMLARHGRTARRPSYAYKLELRDYGSWIRLDIKDAAADMQTTPAHLRQQVAHDYAYYKMMGVEGADNPESLCCTRIRYDKAEEAVEQGAPTEPPATLVKKKRYVQRKLAKPHRDGASEFGPLLAPRKRRAKAENNPENANGGAGDDAPSTSIED